MTTFLFLGGMLATLNHTRFDVTLRIGPVILYAAAAHDVHHRVPLVNYGNYIQFWDYVLGTYREYGADDRISAKGMQLDGVGGFDGKSFDSGAKKVA